MDTFDPNGAWFPNPGVWFKFEGQTVMIVQADDRRLLVNKLSEPVDFDTTRHFYTATLKYLENFRSNKCFLCPIVNCKTKHKIQLTN